MHAWGLLRRSFFGAWAGLSIHALVKFGIVREYLLY